MKAYFLKRTTRERLLILVFLFAAAVVWLVSAAGRVGVRWREGRSVAVDLEAQQLWLDRRVAIESRAAQAAGSLDPIRTLDATRLVGEVSALAGKAGLSAGVESPRTQRTDQFAYHNVQVTFRRADMGALVKFYRELGGRAPYLALENCRLSANRINPSEIDATFAIFSVEVNR
jgi:hypothetical protein